MNTKNRDYHWRFRELAYISDIPWDLGAGTPCFELGFGLKKREKGVFLCKNIPYERVRAIKILLKMLLKRVCNRNKKFIPWSSARPGRGYTKCLSPKFFEERVKIFPQKFFALKVGLGREELQGILAYFFLEHTVGVGYFLHSVIN